MEGVHIVRGETTLFNSCEMLYGDSSIPIHFFLVTCWLYLLYNISIFHGDMVKLNNIML